MKHFKSLYITISVTKFFHIRKKTRGFLGILLIAFLTSVPSSISFAGDLSTATKASDKARITIKKAIDNKDSGLLASLFTSEGAIITPNGYTVSGRLKIRMAAKMIMLAGETGELTTSRQSVSMVDGAAYETGSYKFTLTGSDSKRNKVINGHYTIIWRQEDKTWKIHRAIGI